MTATRRLAAILAADVAGYSRLIGTDEEGTLNRLRSIRADVIHPKITKNRGRIVKTTGDGMLVEFSSVIDALRCATEWQHGMGERNAASAARIGLYKWAWDFMLRHFDRHSDWKLSFCDGPVDKSCPRQIAFNDYPTALHWFLAKHGYLMDQQEPKAEATQEVSTEFTDGLSDRRAWEQWFGGLTGEFREGASFWSGQRSLPKPGLCSDQRYSQQFISGCAAAKAQLMRSDSRRKSEPDYRRGWNSYPE
jgi:hypothetical protein